MKEAFSRRVIRPETRNRWITWVYMLFACAMLLHHVWVTIYFAVPENGAPVFRIWWYVLAGITIVLGRMWKDKCFWILLALLLLKLLRVAIPFPQSVVEFTRSIYETCLYAFFICYGAGRVLAPADRKRFVALFCGLWTAAMTVLACIGLYTVWNNAVIGNLGDKEFYVQTERTGATRLWAIYHPVEGGIMASIGIAVALTGFCLTKRKWIKALYIPAMIAIFLMGIFTNSRTNLILTAMGVCTPVCLLIYEGLRKIGKQNRGMTLLRLTAVCVLFAGLTFLLVQLQQEVVPLYNNIRTRGSLLVRNASAESDPDQQGFSEQTGTMPEITEQPSGTIYGKVGDTVDFRVSAGNVTGYQWYYRESESKPWTAVSGGASATLSVTVSPQYDGYQYVCMVWNENDYTYTDIATLRVTFELLAQPADITAIAGTTATFSVTANGGDLHYAWYCRAPGTTGAGTQVGSDSSTLSVEAAEQYNGYTYLCEIYNHGELQASTDYVTLKVVPAPVYTVKLNPNGGSVSAKSITVTYGQAYGAMPVPTRTGYTFVGWWTEKGKQVTPSTICHAGRNYTLYARWSESTNFTVTLNANGGSVDPATMVMTYGTEYGAMPTPTRTGYTFTGWWTKKSGGKKITDATVCYESEDLTLYARWKKTETGKDGQIILQTREFVMDKGADKMLNNRVNVWQDVFKAFEKEPGKLLWGQSVYNVIAPINELRSEKNAVYHTHNTFIQTLWESGIPGFLLFFAFFVIFARNAVTLTADRSAPLWQRLLPVPAALCWIADLVDCTGYCNWGKPPMTVLYLFTGLVIAVACERRAMKKKKAEPLSEEAVQAGKPSGK